MRILLVTFFMAFSAYGWGQQKIETFHKNGRLASTGSLKLGKEEGLWVYYDSTGVKLQETEFKDGAVNGKLTYFYRDGTIQNQGTFKAGLLNGYYFENYTNGNPRITGYYNQAKKDSTWTHSN